jgi:hypothetical protein
MAECVCEKFADEPVLLLLRDLAPDMEFRGHTAE